MKCFYHNDLDGRCSAFCVHAWVGIKPNPNQENIEFIEINYNKKFPLDSIIPGEQIWIVDYSISPEEMLQLLEITEDVTWIDHHKTAIDKYSDFPKEIKGIRRDGEAACVLTWKYIHWYTDRGDLPNDVLVKELEVRKSSLVVPTVLEFVQDWDLRKLVYGDYTLQFKAGCDMEDTSPDSSFWLNCIDNKSVFEQTVNVGKVVLKYQSQWAKDFMWSWSFPVLFEGYRCIAANLGNCSSDYFKTVKEGSDILMPFIFDGTHWTVSLYSETVDVSVIAKKYGGGGHKGAAGFVCDQLPFTIE